MEAARALGLMPGRERLAAGLTSARGKDLDLSIADIRDNAPGGAFAWQGWESSSLPAMARLALNRARAMDKQLKTTRGYAHPRPERVAEAMAWTAIQTLARKPAAGSSGLKASALDLLSNQMPHMHAHDVKPAFLALAQTGNETGFERLINLLPPKTARDPSWSAAQAKKETERASGHPISAAAKFWNYGVMGAESSYPIAVVAGSARGGFEKLDLGGSVSPIAMALSCLPNRLDLAVALAERGWLVGEPELALGSARLPDELWARLQAAHRASWLHGGQRHGFQNALSPRETGAIARLALAVALDADDPLALARARARWPGAQGGLIEVKRTGAEPGPSVLALAAGLGAGRCLEALEEEIKALKTRSVPVAEVCLIHSGGKASEREMVFIPSDSYGRLRSGLNFVEKAPWPERGKRERDDRDELAKVSWVEAALLSGDLRTIKAVARLEPSFAQRAQKGLERFNALLTPSAKKLAGQLISAEAEAKSLKPIRAKKRAR